MERNKPKKVLVKKKGVLPKKRNSLHVTSTHMSVAVLGVTLINRPYPLPSSCCVSRLCPFREKRSYKPEHHFQLSLGVPSKKRKHNTRYATSPAIPPEIKKYPCGVCSKLDDEEGDAGVVCDRCDLGDFEVSNTFIILQIFSIILVSSKVVAMNASYL